MIAGIRAIVKIRAIKRSRAIKVGASRVKAAATGIAIVRVGAGAVADRINNTAIAIGIATKATGNSPTYPESTLAGVSLQTGAW